MAVLLQKFNFLLPAITIMINFCKPSLYQLLRRFQRDAYDVGAWKARLTAEYSGAFQEHWTVEIFGQVWSFN